MKPRNKNLTALALLAALFGISTIHLARGNRKLASELEELRETAEQRTAEREDLTISSRSQRTREKTVGQVLQQLGGFEDARGLLRKYILGRQSQDDFAISKLKHQVNGMTLDELRLLRTELRRLPGLYKDEIEKIISKAEAKLAPDDPGLFFDGVVKAVQIDDELQLKLQDWAASDPTAAIAWFQSKKAASDFHTGTIAGRKNRAMVLAGLLRGIASQDLALAVELFSKETRRDARIAGGKELIPLAIKRATEGKGESLLRTLLETAVTDESPFGWDTANPWFDYTKTTGDPIRSAELLNSLKNQDSFGRKMSAIISTQDEMPYREKVEWLKEQIPDQEQRLQAYSSIFVSQLDSLLFNGSDEPYRETLNTLLAHDPGADRDLELHAAVMGLNSRGRTGDARSLAKKITEPTRRAQAMAVLEEVDRDPFLRDGE